MKTCNRCHVALPVAMFAHDKGKKDGLHGTCKPCHSAYSKERYARPDMKARAKENADRWRRQRVKDDPLYLRKRWLKSQYGMSLDDYDRLLAIQDGVCAICRREGELFVDHDHDTGQVRGLLCDPCNRWLGWLGDNEFEVKRRADMLVSYLRTVSERTVLEPKVPKP